MLALLIWLVPAVVSVPLVVSDFRCRRVSVLWLAAVFLVCTAVAVYTESPLTALHHLLAGCILIVLLMLCLTCYLWLRYGRARLGDAFGAGDWCYIVALSPLFSLSDLLKLLVAAALLSLVWYRLLNRGRRRTIPFAGIIGITLTGVIIIRFCTLWTI